MKLYRWIAIVAISGLDASSVSAQGPFEALAPVPAPLLVTELEVGQLGPDPFPDVLLAGGGVSSFSVCRGDGTGVEPAWSRALSFAPSALAMIDRDGDGVAELLVARPDPAAVLVHTFDGTEYILGEVVPTAGLPTDLAIADLDSDGNPEWIVTSQVTAGLDRGQIEVHFAGLASPVAFDLAQNPTDVTVADWNGDGLLDIVVASRGDGVELGGIEVIAGAGGTSFTPPETLATGQYWQIEIADVDGNGEADLIARTSSPSCSFQPVVARQQLGQLLPWEAIPSLPCVESFRIFDVEGDGDADVIATLPGVFFGSGGEVVFLENDGQGNFDAGTSIFPGPSALAAVVTADFDLDGRTDLAVSVTTGELVVLLNRTGSTPFVRGDANIDGAIDVSDALTQLASLFVPGTPALPCADAADTNDDGQTDVSDVIATLSYLFVPGSPPPPAPDACGIDPTADPLLCTDGGCP